MTEKFSLGTDVWGQVRETLVFEGDSAHVRFDGDNTAQMDANAIMRNDGSNGFNAERDFRKIAELDPASAYTLAIMWGVAPLSPEFDEKFLKLIQSGDFRNLKTASGNVPDAMVKPKWL